MQKDLKGLYFPVLDHGFVSLVDYMGTDQSVVQAARVSYGPGTKKVSDDRSLIRYLMRAGHHSVLEQCECKFHIGLPILTMRQLVRHRIGVSLNETSGRYSILPQLFYAPTKDRYVKQSKSNKQGSDTEPAFTPEEYDEFLAKQSALRHDIKEHYQWCLSKGLTRELARIDLPVSTYTYIYWKANLREIFHVLKLRLDPHAQWEIQQYARVIAGIVKELYPLCWEAFVDYTLGGVSFSRQERQLLNRLILAPDVKLDGLDEEYFTSVAKNGYNMSSREINEFFEKLRIDNMFSDESIQLDYSLAKDASHYENLISVAANG